jgi:hypothetical protein
MQVSAATFAQKLTYSKEGATLEQIFKEIRKQTGYNVVYSSTQLDDSKRLDVDFKNTGLTAVLDQLKENQGLVYSIDDKNISIKEKEPSFLDNLVARFSAIDIRGKIIGENDQVLVGATVRVKGTNRITKSDEKGEFYLANVEDDAVLEISYIGFKALEISVKGAVMPLEIKLNVATGELEEVKVLVNTGYQTLPKERATGAFTVIDNKTLNQQVGTNILNRLNGVTSGLSFNTGKRFNNSRDKTGISIRGLSTINGPLDPLIVLDDFIYEGDVSNINPNDIESVSILKDAAAGGFGNSSQVILKPAVHLFRFKVCSK